MYSMFNFDSPNNAIDILIFYSFSSDRFYFTFFISYVNCISGFVSCQNELIYFLICSDLICVAYSVIVVVILIPLFALLSFTT